MWLVKIMRHADPGLTRKQFECKAAEAQAMADKVVSAVDKESWLRVAQGWLSLIRNAPRTKAEEFTDEVDARGTNQDDSTKSH